MTKEKLSKGLKFFICAFAVSFAAFYFYGVPHIGKGIVLKYPEFSSRFYPWLVFIILTGIPVFISMVYAYKISDTVGKDRAFCFENAKRFKAISLLALLDSAFFILGNIVLLLFSMNHPSIVILSLCISFAGFAVSLIAKGLQLMTENAAKLQEDSDLTI